MPETDHTHEEYMHKEDCVKDMRGIQNCVDKISLALYGEDGRGGMVSDIKDIKAYTGIARQVLVPIVIAVVSALLTAWGLSGFHI